MNGSDSFNLYDGSKIEKDTAIPINCFFQDVTGSPVSVESNDCINISWNGFYFSFRMDFGDKYHFQITEINSSGYWGRIILLDIESNQYLDISRIYNLTQVIIWKDEGHSSEFYYRETLKLNSLPNMTSIFDQEENLFIITNLGPNGTTESEIIVNTLTGVTKLIRIYNSSSSLRGTFACENVELFFPAYPSQNNDISLNQVMYMILLGLLITSFSLLLIIKFRQQKSK
ncbi:MAG: hypothetical protein ACFE9L_16930 [Candidatus Hodarchaeota archaeon]